MATAFTQLRRRVRQSGRQFRRNNDNSQSIFHPDGGFVYAYDISEVEQALDAFENALPRELQEGGHLSLEQKLLKEAQYIVATHEEMKIRDFARTVAGYLVLHTTVCKTNPLTLLKTEGLDDIK